MRSLFISLSALALIVLTGCEKNNNSEPEVATTILITSPSPAGLYVNGGTMGIEGEMSDDNVLTNAKVEIRNKATGAILYQQSTSTGNVGFYRFLWNWTITGVTAPVTTTVKVIAKDKLNNEVFKEMDVQIVL
jgi:hypothetical protein